ncbi:hypothetical protein ACFE04_014295 [Oxalis oulophora]
MTTNPVSLARKSPLLYRCVALSRKPTSHVLNRVRIPINPVRTTVFRGCSYPLNNCGFSGGVVKELRQSKVGAAQSDSDIGSGSGGGGGFGGSDGGGSGGGDSGGSGDTGSSWSFLSWYLALLEKYPVLTKAVTSALLTFIGDLICQLVIDKAAAVDWKRTFVFTLLGLGLVGPTLHFWYLTLSQLVTKPGASGAILRLLLDQFLFSPLFIGVFLSSLVTLEGRPTDVIPKLKQEWFSAVLANWQLWIPFQFLNFRFVPQQFQVLAANVIALVWNVILSFKAHKEILPK